MCAFEPRIDDAFREFAELELRCHHLLTVGMENAPETLEAEDRMEKLWEKLDEVQRRSLSGMGSDLIWVRRKGEPPPKGRKTPEEVTPAELRLLAEAIERKDWHTVLHYLRLCAPVLSITAIARLRSQAYDALGFAGNANVFREQVASHFPISDAGAIAAPLSR